MRYIPHTEADISSMLGAIGVKSVEELFGQIPKEYRLSRRLDLPAPRSETEVLEEFDALAAKNAAIRASFLGAGSYRHYIPSAINTILLRQEFYTSYTPYQPEISQGTLQAIFEFQTMVCGLLGMDVANASMYDGSTSLVEGVLMARRVVKPGPRKVLVARSIHPEYREVIRTYLAPLGDEIVEAGWGPDGRIDLKAIEDKLSGGGFYCVAVQYPNFFGVIEDVEAVARIARTAGVPLVTATAEAMALGLLKSPGELGAAIATADGQSFGIPPSFGGPGVGFFATKKEHMRTMPGRLIGETTDSTGQRCFVLTLATREQHIRREKATSNICTNSGMNALAVTIYLSLMGPEGLKKVAILSHAAARKTLAVFESCGFKRSFTGHFFNEFVVKAGGRAASAKVAKAHAAGVLPGIELGRFYPELDGHILACATESTTDEELKALREVLA